MKVILKWQGKVRLCLKVRLFKSQIGVKSNALEERQAESNVRLLQSQIYGKSDCLKARLRAKSDCLKLGWEES